MARAWTSLVAALIAAATLASTAGAGQVQTFTVHEEYDFALEDFCGVEGLTVNLSGVLDIHGQIVLHGPHGLEYFLQHGIQTESLTANGISLTSTARVIEKDMRVTDLGDGSVRVLILATGNAVLYAQDGRAIARNPGQTWLELVFDASGNETSRVVVKESTGRSDDFCDAAVAALS